jgi:hypothetical protein
MSAPHRPPDAAREAPIWWVPANLAHPDPRTPFGRLQAALAAQYAVLTGTDAAAHLTALDALRLALEAEALVAQQQLEAPPAPGGHTMTYLLSCGFSHRAPAALPTFLATPDLALALQAFLLLQQQGYDWCGLTPVPLAVQGPTAAGLTPPAA